MFWMRSHLTSRVNDGFHVSAGKWEQVEGADGNIERKVSVPEPTMGDQVFWYLYSKRDVSDTADINEADEAKILFSACIRWGSYFATLVDRDAVPYNIEVKPNVSRISPDELERINVEASAALERWLIHKRADPEGYLQMLRAGKRYLPFISRQTRMSGWGQSAAFFSLANPGAKLGALLEKRAEDYGDVGREEVESNAYRVLANVIINACWNTNELIQSLCEGDDSYYPLSVSRFRPGEDTEIFRRISGCLKHSVWTVNDLYKEEDRKKFNERVRMYLLVPESGISPIGWSLDEKTRGIYLPGTEPKH